MSDDLDALLTEVDIRCPGGSGLWSGLWSGEFQLEISDPELARRLAAAVREFRADYTAALDVIAHHVEGAFVMTDTEGAWWGYHDVDGKDFGLRLTDREWRVYCDAAQRATRGRT